MKRFIAILFIGIITFSLTACQSDNESQGKNSLGSTSIQTSEQSNVFNVENTTNYNNSDESYNTTVSEKSIEINNIGDIVELGNYEQDSNSANGKEPIEWIVLDVEDDKALLISKYSLDGQRYNDEFVSTSWEKCSLRKWLNSKFLNEAFAKSEQDLILNAGNLNFDGFYENDKVSLLSVNEAERYFDSMETRKTEITEYATLQAEDNATTRFTDGWDKSYWLRSLSEKFDDCAAEVAITGYMFTRVGRNVDFALGVRPIIWVNKNKDK